MTTCAAPIVAALAWVPFLQPLNAHAQWLWFLPPIVFVVALVYKTLKMPTLDGLAAETVRLTGYILLLMAVAAVALWALVEGVERL